MIDTDGVDVIANIKKAKEKLMNEPYKPNCAPHITFPNGNFCIACGYKKGSP